MGGAAFLTVQQGIWSSSTQEGAKALTDFREKVIPTTNDYLKKVGYNIILLPVGPDLPIHHYQSYAELYIRHKTGNGD